MRFPLQLGVAAVVLASATTAQAQMRFEAMDSNRDGVITRSEWRGNDNTFRDQDWNGDGILSGDEVRTGARRQTNWSQDWNRDGRVDNLDGQIAQRFRGYDMNNDNRVARTNAPETRACAAGTSGTDTCRCRNTPTAARLRPRLQGALNIGPNRHNRRRVTRREWNMGEADLTASI